MTNEPDLSDEDREEACREMLRPIMAEISNQAMNAGFTRAEVILAILNVTINEVCEIAGEEVAADLLHGALEQFDSHHD